MNKNRPDWDRYFMNIAEVIKTRSLDPKTQVGCVLVSLKDRRIISTGYNSLQSGMDHNIIDWNDREQVYNLIIHAETNAVLYAKSKYEDSILYTTLSPCQSCIKLLSATGIKKIIYKIEYKDYETTKKLCDIFNIELKKLEY